MSKFCPLSRGRKTPPGRKKRTTHSLYTISPLHAIIIEGVGKEAHKNWSMVNPEKAVAVTGTPFKNYWSCAGGLSVVDAIDTQLLDPIKSGLTRWRLTVCLDAVAESGRNPANKHQI